MSGLARSFKIFSARFRDLSLCDMLVLVAHSFFKCQSILIYSMDLETISTSTAADPGGHIQRPGTDFLNAFRQATTHVEWEFSCDLYDGVKDFFIYEKNGQVGHISWVYYKDDPNRIIDLAPDEAEIKYSLTVEEFRGQGIYPSTLIHIQKYLREKGFRRVFICIDESNTPSRKGLEKAGFSKTGTSRLVKFLGLQLSKRYSSGKRVLEKSG